MPDRVSLKDKVAFVTGGGSGVGAALCKCLAGKGVSVAVVGRGLEKCQAVVDEITAASGTAAAFRSDIGVSSDVKAAVDGAAERFGAIDILINNAGTYCPKRLLEVTDQDLDAVMSSSLTGTFLCTREVYRLMKPTGRGHVINIASQAAGFRDAGEIAYGTAKTAQVKFLIHLVEEFKLATEEHGGQTEFYCHNVCPGGIDTPLWDKVGMLNAPRDRFLKSEEVAELTIEILENPQQGREYFEKLAEPKRYNIGPVGILEPHPLNIRIWNPEE